MSCWKKGGEQRYVPGDAGVGADPGSAGRPACSLCHPHSYLGAVVRGKSVMVPSLPLHGEPSPIEMSGVLGLPQDHDARVGNSDDV